VKKQNQNIGQKGAAAVEFAIILPLLVILVFGIIDISTALYNKQVITNASREGAREGISRSTKLAVRNVAVDYCNSTNRLFPPGTLLSVGDVDVLGGGPGASFQSDLTVTVTHVHNFMFAGIIGLSPTLTMTGRTVMKMEPPPPSP
jgi:Flp pilus assembly protein TadG